MKKTLTDKQKLVLQALVRDGATHAEAAKKAGVAPTTVSRWMNHDELFIQQYEHECRKMYLAAQHLSRSKAGKVLSKLCQLMVCGNERVELAAAKEILDFAESKVASAENDPKTTDREFTVNVNVV